MRTLREIAQEIEQDWKSISPYARPYINAMHSLINIGDHYGADEGSNIVNYFLSNAGSWKGEKAKAIKKELKDMLKSKRASIIAKEILAVSHISDRAWIETFIKETKDENDIDNTASKIIEKLFNKKDKNKIDIILKYLKNSADKGHLPQWKRKDTSEIMANEIMKLLNLAYNQKGIRASIIIAKQILASGTIPNFVKFVDEYVIEDYPYGQLKTKATFKVEKKSDKERIEKITIDPKTGRVNKPKYTPFYEKAKLGITSDNKVYPVTGRLDIIVVWNDDMLHEIASILPKDPDYKNLLKALEIKIQAKVTKVENGVIIDNLKGKPMSRGELMQLAGITPEQKADIDDINRDNIYEWKITFQSKPETFTITIRS